MLHLTDSLIGYICLGLFLLAYVFVVTEEMTHIKKSIPIVIAANLMWILIAITARQQAALPLVEKAIKADILEYIDLIVFLSVSIIYVNAMEERYLFSALSAKLTKKSLTYRQLFWTSGIVAFILSTFINNMTAAILMCAIVMTLSNNKKILILSCINIVVATNAGGVFSPFGDVTTLMIWEARIIDFGTFFHLFVPAVINFIIPACFIHFAIPHKTLQPQTKHAQMAPGAPVTVAFFFITLLLSVLGYQYLVLPPSIGMVTGLFLWWGYESLFHNHHEKKISKHHLVYKIGHVVSTQWDTLFFFYGVILGIGALSTLGYLDFLSNHLYTQIHWALPGHYKALPANTILGLISAIIDNIPVMFAIIIMHPPIAIGSWLTATLTLGVGGSLLAIGSASGVALMGQTQGTYTFMRHLKWSWAILLGYVVSIAAHILINQHLF